ncbi:hypothetical protein [Brevibacillus borstelensis]|uniref:hypothetical protein n=1 Tax=Brevibacillus borstelensis TaxID=45462 RepID=UPI00055E4DFA|nr:hypothetical protein [Brevibacillus borstelensis]KKX54440.1 hypothetical protein X546_15565 [Brevibacillus borstelensis cifa_chp40]
MSTGRKRPTIKIVAEYMMIDGKKVEIDPFQTDLPDRCKLAIAEMTTGQKYELAEAKLLKASGS